MPKVVLIHHDKATLALLEALFKSRFDVQVARDVATGSSILAKSKPDLVLVGHQARSSEAVSLVTWMRDNRVKVPVVVALGANADPIQPRLLKLGVRGFVEHPPDRRRVQQAIDKAVKFHKATQAPAPPVTAEEARANLSVLENQLNRAMKCFAGTNKVFILSQIGSMAKPRICLKCPLRPEFGLPANVYYQFIRDVCCGQPDKCEAYSAFQLTRESA